MTEKGEGIPEGLEPEKPAVTAEGVSSTEDLIGGVLLLALSIFVIFEALGMPEKGRWGFFMGPGFFPFILGVVLLFLTAALSISSIKERGYLNLKTWAQGVYMSTGSRRWLIITTLTGLYVLLLGRVPFVLATFVYLSLVFFYLRVGNILKILVLSIGASIFVGYMVPWVFEMPLP